MKKVKFNVTTSVHMIPDEIYSEHVENMKKMKYNDFKSYQQRLLAGSEYEMRDVKMGDIVDVPNWYFEAHKNDKITISTFIENYKDKMGRPQPFEMADAIKHGHLKEDDKSTRQVSRFSVIEEPILTHKKSSQSLRD
jgi:hypothetical protein